jgi:xylan 1,4-beta-xylosidase
VTQTAICSALALVTGLFASYQAIAKAQDPVTIDIDAASDGTPLKPVWAYFGYDEANYTTLPEARELLRTLATMHQVPVRVRTHFLFNTGNGTPALKWGSTNLYTEDADANPIYDFTLIDQIMDATLEAGVFPLFEIGFMPQALSIRPNPYENSSPYVLDGGAFFPPKDYEKWARLVSAWAEHVKERYPGSESSWLWELWNEPDIAYFQGTFEEYARLYDYTEAALHAVFPDAPLGGPAAAKPDGSFLADFLEHCASGTNAITGQTGTRLDMVTFHAKGGVSLADGRVQMNLGHQLRLHRSGFEAVAASAFSDAPIVVSEADPDGCAACPSTTARHLDYRNSPAYGAYEVAMMKRSLDLADEVGVNLRGVLTWAFTFPDSAYFAGYRALTTNGIHLPVLNAFKLLGRLSGDRLPVRSSGARPLDELLERGVREQPDVDALAARDGNQIQILVWHYHDDLVEADPIEVALTITVPAAFEKGALLTHRRVDETHGNAFTVWRTQGSPVAPSDAELVDLRLAMDSLEFEPERVIDVLDGTVTLWFELPRFGISLLTMTPFSGSKVESSPTADSSIEGGGCSCWTSAGKRTPHDTLLTILLFAALTRRRRARVTGLERLTRHLLQRTGLSETPKW